MTFKLSDTLKQQQFGNMKSKKSRIEIPTTPKDKAFPGKTKKTGELSFIQRAKKLKK